MSDEDDTYVMCEECAKTLGKYIVINNFTVGILMYEEHTCPICNEFFSEHPVSTRLPSREELCRTIINIDNNLVM